MSAVAAVAEPHPVRCDECCSIMERLVDTPGVAGGDPTIFHACEACGHVKLPDRVVLGGVGLFLGLVVLPFVLALATPAASGCLILPWDLLAMLVFWRCEEGARRHYQELAALRRRVASAPAHA